MLLARAKKSIGVGKPSKSDALSCVGSPCGSPLSRATSLISLSELNLGFFYWVAIKEIELCASRAKVSGSVGMICSFLANLVGVSSHHIESLRFVVSPVVRDFSAFKCVMGIVFNRNIQIHLDCDTSCIVGVSSPLTKIILALFALGKTTAIDVVKVN